MKALRMLAARPIVLVLTVALGVCLIPGAAFAVPGTTTLVTVGLGGAPASDGTYNHDISGDGRYVAFQSGSTDLVAGVTDGRNHIFIRDRWLGVTEIVSVSSAEVLGGGASYMPKVSRDGRYVAFLSDATNLVSGDDNGVTDVFVRDRLLGETTRVSVSTGGAQVDSRCDVPAISRDGRYVAFGTAATTLDGGDSNGAFDVYIRDRVAGTTSLVSVGGNLGSSYPSVSDDGNHIAFSTAATSFGPTDTNGSVDVYVRDRQAGTTYLVSATPGFTTGNDGSYAPSISADGRYVAFDSIADNLMAGDNNGDQDVFVRDCVDNVTTCASMNRFGLWADAASQSADISADGNYVAFCSLAGTLVSDDTNGRWDVFRRDRTAGVTERVTVSSGGVESNANTQLLAMSDDGRSVSFATVATNLVPLTTGGDSHVYANDQPPTATTVTIRTSATSARIGGAPILRGAVTPASLIGKNMVVYVKKPGKAYWTYSSNRTMYSVGGAGAWYYKYTFKRGMTKGYYYFKAVVPAMWGIATSNSPTIRIQLR